MSDRCVHCQYRKRLKENCRRSLCFACYLDRGVRALYRLPDLPPELSKYRPRDEPTLEEVVALVDEAKANGMVSPHYEVTA